MFLAMAEFSECLTQTKEVSLMGKQELQTDHQRFSEFLKTSEAKEIIAKIAEHVVIERIKRGIKSPGIRLYPED